jgi:ribulose-phosphate 3-epimerase
MTVHPGYGGQKFIEECMPKVRFLRDRKRDLDIMVDGGINFETAKTALEYGANQLVAGSYLFKQSDMKKAVDEIVSYAREMHNA